MDSMLKAIMHDEESGVIVINVSENIKRSTLRNIINTILEEDVKEISSTNIDSNIQTTLPLTQSLKDEG